MADRETKTDKNTRKQTNEDTDRKHRHNPTDKIINPKSSHRHRQRPTDANKATQTETNIQSDAADRQGVLTVLCMSRGRERSSCNYICIQRQREWGKCVCVHGVTLCV